MNRPRIGPLLRQALTRGALLTAWEKVADNHGMAGSDGESIAQIKPHIGTTVATLAREVIAGHYQPPRVRHFLPIFVGNRVESREETNT